MKGDFLSKVYIAYSVIAVLTLCAFIASSSAWLYDYNRLGFTTKQIVSIALRTDFFYFALLLLISITAFMQNSLAILFGIILAYNVVTDFYLTFLYKNPNYELIGLGHSLDKVAVFLSIFLEIFCFILLAFYLKNKFIKYNRKKQPPH